MFKGICMKRGIHTGAFGKPRAVHDASFNPAERYVDMRLLSLQIHNALFHVIHPSMQLFKFRAYFLIHKPRSGQRPSCRWKMVAIATLSDCHKA